MNEIDIKKAKNQYWNQYGQAHVRKIPWLFTFDEWLQCWIDSGHYHDRGRSKGQYCMSRFNDVGPYSKDNVCIKLHGENVIDAHKGKKKPYVSLAQTGRKLSDITIEKIKKTKQMNKEIYESRN